MTGTEGVARAVLTLGPDPGVGRHLVSATFDGFTGRLAAFTATGVVPGNPASTAFSAAVLDNSQTPIPGAAVTIPDTTVSGLTDEDGQFLLTNVPVGRIHLRIDPTGSPRPETFTPLEFETVTVAGRVNTLGQPILIPALDTASSKIVGGTEDVTLEMTGVAGLTRTVFANSVTFPDGSPTGALTISQVHLDKVPMAPPGGSIFMSPAWTIQPAGVTFDPPARITIPNNGLPPGRVIDLFQFDHDLNMFIGVGTGTVSADGSLIVSDPGFGITAAGWGGGRPTPPATTSVPHCGQCEVARGNPTVCERISIVNVDAKADARDALVRPIDRAINFTATVNRGNCTSVQFVWDFGDGTTSTEQNPTHTFADPGVYNVTVTAKCGTCSEKTDSVQVTAVKVEISDVVRGPGLPPSVSPTKDVEVEVTITPSLASTGQSVEFDVVNGDADNGTATVTENGTRTTSGTVTVEGGTQTEPGSHGQLRIRARLDGIEVVQSNGFSVCAHPDAVEHGASMPLVGDPEVGFDVVGMRIEFTYRSDSGTNADLDQVMVSEFIGFAVEQTGSLAPVDFGAQRRQVAFVNGPGTREDRHFLGPTSYRERRRPNLLNQATSACS